MKLFIYEHCPFCTKAQMIFGLKGIPVEVEVLSHDDEKTPMKMIGQKMVPILETDDGRFMPESMEIVRYVDGLSGDPLIQPGSSEELTAWLAQTKDYFTMLTLSRYVEAPLQEFSTDKARAYFRKKKELQFGSFSRHRAETARLIPKAHTHLALLEPLIVSPEGVHGPITEDDFHLFAILRALSIVKGLKFPEKVEAYRQTMSEKAKIANFDKMART